MDHYLLTVVLFFVFFRNCVHNSENLCIANFSAATEILGAIAFELNTSGLTTTYVEASGATLMELRMPFSVDGRENEIIFGAPPN